MNKSLFLHIFLMFALMIYGVSALIISGFEYHSEGFSSRFFFYFFHGLVLCGLFHIISYIFDTRKEQALKMGEMQRKLDEL